MVILLLRERQHNIVLDGVRCKRVVLVGLLGGLRLSRPCEAAGGLHLLLRRLRRGDKTGRRFLESGAQHLVFLGRNLRRNARAHEWVPPPTLVLVARASAGMVDTFSCHLAALVNDLAMLAAAVLRIVIPLASGHVVVAAQGDPLRCRHELASLACDLCHAAVSRALILVVAAGGEHPHRRAACRAVLAAGARNFRHGPAARAQPALGGEVVSPRALACGTA
mmetsp:Transcript_166333/g.534219  ORF Transcript_166333/g.534219 Transcript_166333/m.534219 type:complete len:222 (+) Transcript_166333:400-1065(+)